MYEEIIFDVRDNKELRKYGFWAMVI